MITWTTRLRQNIRASLMPSIFLLLRDVVLDHRYSTHFAHSQIIVYNSTNCLFSLLNIISLNIRTLTWRSFRLPLITRNVYGPRLCTSTVQWWLASIIIFFICLILYTLYHNLKTKLINWKVWYLTIEMHL